MIGSIPADGRPSRNHMRHRDIFFSGLLFSLLCLWKIFLQYAVQKQLYFTDDAFYYIVIARHLSESGKSTFDGLTLTNGYHPLWLWTLALQYKLFSQSLLLTRCIECALGLVSLIATLLVVRLPDLLLNLFFSIGFFFLLSKVAFNGMETTIFAACFALLALSLSRGSPISLKMGVLDGLLAAAAIASREDCAVFVVPYLLLATTARRRLTALGVLAASGLFYVWSNYLHFGGLLPISGEIKSLGGLQFNRMFAHQLTAPFVLTAGLLYIAILLAILSPLLWRVSENRALQPFLQAYAVGLLLYLLRLTFMSSWVIWNWYDYPILIGYIGCAPILFILLERKVLQVVSYTKLTYAAAAFLLIFAALLVRSTFHSHGSKEKDFSAINNMAIQRYGGLLHGARVAMGDRAGSFVYFYSGGVDQTEGLVNDRQYFEVLKRRGDIKALLCQRNDRYLVGYAADLGSYRTFNVETIRHHLSQFNAPTIEVRSEDQIGKIGDPSIFPDKESSIPYLYIWKLNCAK